MSADPSGVFGGQAAVNRADWSIDRPISIQNRFGRILTFVESVTDGVTVAVAILGGFLAYHWLHLGKQVDYSPRSILIIAVAMSVLYVILLDRDGAYLPGSSLLKIKETERALRVSVQAFLLALPITFFAQYRFSRWIFLITLFCVPFLLVLKKQLIVICVRGLRARGIGVQRVLVYGAGASGQRAFSALARSAPKLGLKPVAMVDDNPHLDGRVVYSQSYRRQDSVRVTSEPVTASLLKRLGCGLLVVAVPSLDGDKFAQLIQAARIANCRVAHLPAQATEFNYWTEEADIDGLMLSFIGRPTKEWHYILMKRAFDFVASISLVALLSPVWLAIAFLVRADSRGPIFFRQKRCGRNGKTFNLYKFRSMHIDAPKYDFSPRKSEDPRITRIGRFLRRTSLDELPQLMNVLRGEMSLVGPRPEMPFIVEQYNPIHRQRLEVPPGITGLWQLSADRAFLIHENIQYDLYYIRNRSFFMDIAILLHTGLFAMHGV